MAKSKKQKELEAKKLEARLLKLEGGNGERLGIKSHAYRLAKSRTAWLTLVASIFGAIMIVDKGLPVAQKWGGGVVSWFISPEVEKMEKIGETIEAVSKVPTLVATVTARLVITEGEIQSLKEANHDCLMELRDLAVRHDSDMEVMQTAQKNQRDMTYNIWADVRAMRGAAPPPTPEPVATIVPRTP